MISFKFKSFIQPPIFPAVADVFGE